MFSHTTTADPKGTFFYNYLRKCQRPSVSGRPAEDLSIVREITNAYRRLHLRRLTQIGV